MSSEHLRPEDSPTQFVLRSGRVVRLEALHQEWTYRGLIEGIPIPKINEFRLAARREWAARLWNAPVHLIPPKYRDYAQTPGDHTGVVFMGQKPQFLPDVTCYGLFRSKPVAPGFDSSCLTLFWFQETFGPPLEAEIKQAICEIDWESVAQDFEI